MKKVMLITVVSAVVIFGCTKEKEIDVQTPALVVNNSIQTEEHIPLAIGNYWVYETVSIDTLGNETQLTSLDSAYIDRDTLINGNTYYIISGGAAINHIMGSTIRNTNNTIVNFNYQGIDKIIFSSNNLEEIYRTDTINSSPFQFYSTTKTSLSKVSKNVVSGIFDCYEGVSSLTQILPTNITWSKTEKRYYEKNVGLVTGQYTYYASSNILELRLLRYHLN